MAYFVYILYSKSKDKRYIGQTSDLHSRLMQHNTGKNKSTVSGMPWVLYCYKQLETRAEAMSFERKIKNLKSRVKQDAYFEKHNFIMQEVIGPEK